VEVLFEGRTLSVTDGSFSDAFIADDVHIYRMDGVEMYLPAVSRGSVSTSGLSE
jgi:hypothetical protein